MFPSRFDYAAPESLDEVLTLLAERPDEAKVLAGGQSLIPLMKLRFAAPALIIDINRVPGLDGVEENGGHLRIGALVRNSELERSGLLKRRYPAMAAAAPLISDPIVRNLGTLGGSLAHADPAGDWGSVMLALGAEIVARSSSAERVIPIDEFLQDTFTTTLEPNELLTEIRVPQPSESTGGAYLKLERKVGDFATVGTAVQLDLNNETIGRAGIALTAVGATNIRAVSAENALAGAEPTQEAFEEAARLAAEDAEPFDDVRGSADYKRAIVRTYVKRGLDLCLQLSKSQ